MADDGWDAAVYGAASSFQTAEGADLAMLVGPQPGERILDVGCGDGRVTELLAASGSDVVGLDPSASMVAATAARGLRAVVARAERLPFAPAAFDVVVSNAALHWSTDHEACIAELVRVLGPGGRLLVRVGGPGNQWRVFAECVRLLAEPPFERHRPRGFRLPLAMADPAQWMAALTERGMRVETFEIEAVGPGWTEPEQMRRWLRPIAAPCTAVLPGDLAEAFLDEVVARTWPQIDRAACFVRLVVAATKQP